MPRPSRPASPLRHPARAAQPEAPADAVPGEKLHKMLAAAGLGSRRDMEELIASGRLTINGKPAQVGDRVTSTDTVRLDGRPVRLPWKAQMPRVMIYHKQEGEIVSKDDPQGRPSVFNRLPRLKGARWISVGRLDFNTEGLMVFTTSGELANRLAHPRYEVEREYAVRVLGELTREQMDALVHGVELEDGLANVETIAPASADTDSVNRWYHLVIREGRNREVRRIFEALGLTVSRLIRVRFGPIPMPPKLKRGMQMELSEAEVTKLLEWAELKVPRGTGRARSGGKVGDPGHGTKPYRRRMADSKPER